MTKSHRNKLFLGAGPGAGCCRAIPFVNAEEGLPASHDPRIQFHSAESSLIEHGLARFGAGILVAAAILGLLLVRLLALAFETEISVLKRLYRSQEERRFRDQEALSRWGSSVSRWDWAI